MRDCYSNAGSLSSEPVPFSWFFRNSRAKLCNKVNTYSGAQKY